MKFVESNVLTGHSKAVVSCKICPRNSQLVASASADASAKIWDMDDGQCRATLNGHKEGICDLAWTAAGDYICTASDDHTLKLWVSWWLVNPSMHANRMHRRRRTPRPASASRRFTATRTTSSAATSTPKATSSHRGPLTRRCVCGTSGVDGACGRSRRTRTP